MFDQKVSFPKISGHNRVKTTVKLFYILLISWTKQKIQMHEFKRHVGVLDIQYIVSYKWFSYKILMMKKAVIEFYNYPHNSLSCFFICQKCYKEKRLTWTDLDRFLGHFVLS